MFNIAKVTSVYSGRKGCACGCRGNYAYASAFKSERPSYCDGDEWVSDRTVKTIVNKVERMLRDKDSDVASIMVDADWIAVDLRHDRTYTIYFAEDSNDGPH